MQYFVAWTLGEYVFLIYWYLFIMCWLSMQAYYTYICPKPHKSFQSRKNYTLFRAPPPHLLAQISKTRFREIKDLPILLLLETMFKTFNDWHSLKTTIWPICAYRVSSTGWGTVLPWTPIDPNFLDYIWYAVLVIFYLTQLNNIWRHLSMLLDVILLCIFQCIFIERIRMTCDLDIFKLQCSIIWKKYIELKSHILEFCILAIRSREGVLW